MTFDPEKVQRLSQLDVESLTPIGSLYDPLWVSSSSYDQLLELYRRLKNERPDEFNRLLKAYGFDAK